MAVVTEDGTEHFDYLTKSGDSTSDLEPIGGLIEHKDWKQRFFQTVYQKFRSHRPLPQLLTDHDECENTLERGGKNNLKFSNL